MLKKILIILFTGMLISTIFSEDQSESIKNIVRNSEPELEDIPNQFIQEEETFEYDIIATDPDEDELTYDASISGNGAVSVAGNQLTIEPEDNFNGDIQVEVTVSDGEFTVSDEFTLTVTPVNDEPELGDIPNQSIQEEGTFVYNIIATDPDEDELTYDAIISGNGAVSVAGNQLTIEPEDNFNGNIQVEVTVSDDEFTVSDEFTLAVTPVNDEPVLDTIEPIEFIEDQGTVLNVSAEDVDQDNLTYGCVSSVAEIQCSVFGTQITFSSDLNYNGSEQVTISVTDGEFSDFQDVTVTIIPDNDAPTFEDIDDVEFDEGGSETVELEASDVDSNSLIYGCTSSANIECTMFNNEVTFVAFDEDYNGSENLQVTVTDGDLSDSQMVSVTINSVNDAPILASIGPINFIEDGSEIITVSATDADENDLVFQCSNTGNFNVGCTVDDNQITFFAFPDFNGDDTVTIFVTDGNLSDSEEITVTVQPDNDAPELEFIEDFSFNEDATHSITVNASDIENDNLTYSCTTEVGANITCQIFGNQINFDSPDDWFGTETVTITVSDGFLEDSQEVQVEVISENDFVWLIEEIDDIQVNEDSDDITIELSEHFNDIEDGPNLNYSIVTLGSLSGDISTSFSGTVLTIDFLLHQHGNDDVVIRACDSDDDCLDETFNIMVFSINDPPILDNIPAPPSEIVVNQEYEWLVDPSNADADDFQFDFIITDSPGSGASSITATENNQYANFLWYPNAIGAYSITIKITDWNEELGINGDLSEEYTWDVNVIAASDNSPPVIAAIDEQQIQEDNTFTYTLDITDANDPLEELNVNVYDEYLQQVSFGTTVEANFINGEWILTLIPEDDWNGEINVVISVSDQLNSANREFILNVEAVNDTPSFEFIDDCDIEFNEDTELTYNLYIHDIDSHSYYNNDPVFLAEGEDVNYPDQTIDYVLTPYFDDVLQIEGSLLLDQIIFENETNFYDENNDLNQMTFIPIDDFYGTQLFNLHITDGELEYDQDFSVCITNVNDPPIISIANIPLDYDEDTTSGPIVASAVDDVVDPLYYDSPIMTYSCVALEGNEVTCVLGEDGETFTFNNDSEPHFFGTRDFRIYVNDNDGATDYEDITVTVNPINDAPVAQDITTSVFEDGELIFAFDYSDIEDHEGVFTILPDPATLHGDVENLNDGTFKYTPDAEYPNTNSESGSDSFQFYVTDIDTDSSNNSLQSDNNATVTIEIIPVNDFPVLAFIDDFSFDEDTVSDAITLEAEDLDNDELEYLCHSNDGNLICTVDNDQLTVENAIEHFNGDAEILVTVQDNQGGVDSQVVTVTVIPVNDRPTVPDDDIEISTNEDISIENEPFIGEDVDGDLLTYNIQTSTINGVLTVSNDQTTWSYIPTAEFNGQDSFTYRVFDTDTESLTDGTVIITVIPGNDTPVFDDDYDDIEFNEDESFTFGVSATDVDNDELEYLCIAPQELTCTVLEDQITITNTVQHFNGDDISIQIMVQDIPSGAQDIQTIEVDVLPVNDAPTVADFEFIIAEDFGAYTFDLLGEDVDGDDLVYTIPSQAANGTIENNDNGTATYTPYDDYPYTNTENGTDSFTYFAFDGFLSSVEPDATVTVTIIPENDDPVIVATEDFDFDEDTTITISPVATDVDNDDLTFVCNSTVQDIFCVVNDATDEITFSASLDYNGQGNIILQAFDGNSYSAFDQVTVTVNPVNDAPTVENLSYTINEDQELTIEFDGDDVDGDLLSYSIEQPDPLIGFVLNNTDGTATYTPADDYNGTEVIFYYTANDGLLNSDIENPASITIEIIADNDPPVFDPEVEDVTFAEDGGTTINVFATDADFDELTFECIPTIGNVICEVDQDNDQIIFSAVPDYNGTEIVSIGVSDGVGDNLRVSTYQDINVEVTPVNDIPEVSDMPDITTEEEVQVVIILQGSDVDGDELEYTILNSPENGELINNGNAIENYPAVIIGSDVTYVPNPDFVDVDTFNYRCNDGEFDSIGAGIVTITVIDTNDPPIAEDITIQVSEDGIITFNFDASDADGDQLTYEIVTQPVNGTADNPDSGVSVTYEPIPDYTGGDSFTYKANDGEFDSNVATVFITVSLVNDSPVLGVIDSIIYDEDGFITFTLEATDTENDDLFFSCEGTANVQCIVDGSDITISNGPNSEHYNNQGSPVDMIRIIVEDAFNGADHQDVGVTVSAVNDEPITLEFSMETEEDTPIEVDLYTEASIINVDNLYSEEPLDFFLIQEGDNGTCTIDEEGILTYNPLNEFPHTNLENGSDICSFYATDVEYQSNTSNINISVTPLNDAPVLNEIEDFSFPEDQNYILQVIAIDVDNDELTYSCIQSENISCVVDGDKIIVTNKFKNFFGTETITIIVDDGNQGQDTQDVNVTVVFANDAPELSAIENFSFNEDETTIINVIAYDPDPKTSLVFDCKDSENILCQIEKTETEDDHTFIATIIFSSILDFFGEESVVISVDDEYGRAIDSQAVKVNVIPINDAPVTKDINTVTKEDTSIIIDLTEYTNDVDSKLLTYELIHIGLNGKCTIDKDGMVLYTPQKNYPTTNDKDGFDSCTYIVNDGKLESKKSTINIDIISINDAPVTTNIKTSTLEDESVLIDLTFYTTDIESDALNYTITNQAANGICKNNFDGTITYTPNQDFPYSQIIEKDLCTYEVSDGFLISNESKITISIIPINDNPVLDKVDDVVFKEDKGISFPVFATDVDNDVLTYSCISSDNIGCTVKENIITVFASTEHFYGEEKILIVVEDDYKGYDAQQILVTVTFINDYPILHKIKDIEFKEDKIFEMTISGNDPDPDDVLSFYCEGNENVKCEIDKYIDYQDGVFYANITISTRTNFYGSEDITFIVDDGYQKRYTDAQVVKVTVHPINDAPTIKAVSFNINNGLQIELYDKKGKLYEDYISDNYFAYINLQEEEQINITFEIGDPDSLYNPDKLLMNNASLGVYDGNDIGIDFDDIDLEKTCPFEKCVIINEDYAECSLDCHSDFNAEFIHEFIINDGYVNVPIEMHLNIKQINDPVQDIDLEEGIFSYADDIKITELIGPEINELVYYDKTKFFDGNTLTNSNNIPENYNMDDIEVYRQSILSATPTYYFIWNRSENSTNIDVDTDPTLNQYPYDIYYRLELVYNNAVYVIKDDILDSGFQGKFAYTIAEIDPDVVYPKYSNGSVYIPSLSNNEESLQGVNNGEYRWRIAGQNYSTIDNGKEEKDCNKDNEVWMIIEEYCKEFDEDDGLISYNDSELFNLDIQYTKGAYQFLLNEFYIDHYDMYFIPNDGYVIEQNGYENDVYIQYIDFNDGFNEQETIEVFEDANGPNSNVDVFHTMGNLDKFGNIIMYVIAVDEQGNTFINSSDLFYEFVYPNQINNISTPSENIILTFNEDAFEGESRVLIYEKEYEGESLRETSLISNLINIQSNQSNFNSDALIYFDFQDLSSEYDIRKIKFSKFENNEFIELQTYIDGVNVFSEIDKFGTYAVIYNPNSSENSTLPKEFGITSCYPNPFNPTISIAYSLSSNTNMKLSIYNILGQEINVLENKFKLKGDYIINWNGLNKEGSLMPSGVYFIEINNFKSKDVRRVTLLK